MLRLGKLMVKWQHFNPTNDRSMRDKYGRKWVRLISNKEFFGTICTIKVIEPLAVEGIGEVQEELVVTGKSKLHRYNHEWSIEKQEYMNGFDEFNKETGRKLSLQNALKELNLSKAEREGVWNDYNNRCKEPIQST